MAAGHGGQVLVSAATAEILGRDVELTSLGEHRLRDLSTPERVFQLSAAEFPRLRSLDSYPGNLPLQLSSFVGRERELEQVVAAVRNRPLVTLTGAGGVGKTRLAVHVAAELVPQFVGGAWLVELGSISDPDAVPQVIASTLGLRQRDGMTLTQSLVEYLNARRSLIVLDNCEHLLDAAAAVAKAIVRVCAETRIVATSREGLGVVGDHLIVVRSLPSPADDVPFAEAAHAAAVMLFVDRARASDADFALTEQNVPAVTQLCRRLDGVPFAIELAAARVAALTPEDIVARLDQRFRLLSGGGRASLERHQTLRRTVDWSYQLLEARDRTVFNRLSIFAGSFDISAAEAIVADDGIAAIDVVDAVVSLVAKSMVSVDTTAIGRRYRMLETIRQYGRDQLAESGETEQLRRRHADYFVTFARQADRGLRTAAEAMWHQRLMASLDDLRQVIELAVDTADTDLALRLCSALEFFTWTRFTTGVHNWHVDALALPGADYHPDATKVFGHAAVVEVMIGDPHRAEELVRRGMAAATPDTASVSPALWTAFGGCELIAGRVSACVEAWQVAAELAVSEGEPGLISFTGANLCYVLSLTDRRVDAEEVGWRALAQAKRTGCPSLVAWATVSLATVIVPRDPNRAVAMTREALSVAQDTGSDFAQLNGVSCPILPLVDAGRVSDALVASAEYFDLQHRIGQRMGLLMQLDILGVIAVDMNEYETARVCFAVHPDSYGGLLPASRRDAARARTDAALDPTIAAQLDQRASAMNHTELADFGKRAAQELTAIVERDGAS